MKIGLFECPPEIVRYMSGGGGRKLGLQRLKQYSDRMQRDFDAMKPWLPDDAAAVLDIGCGLGGIDVMLARHYGDSLTVYLADGDGGGHRKMGFVGNTEAWADVSRGETFFRANAPKNPVECRVCDNQSELDGLKVDLVVSLKSWGHHYPVGVYADTVRGAIAQSRNARVIIDIRRGTDGAAEMGRRGFKLVGKVAETVKCERLAFSL